ncbi:MAG TPA: IS66 family transposase [Polyangiaceae bacterium]
MPPDDHDCGWRQYALGLQDKLEKVQAELSELKRLQLGPKSEKLPSMQRQVRRNRDQKEALAEARRKRRERAIAKTKLVTEPIDVKVPEEQHQCPKCGNPELRNVGDGKPSTIYEYVPGYFRRQIYRRETLACRCGEYIVNAPCPDKTTDKTQYGPGFIAHLMVSKCGDSIPLYRLEKQYRRVGIPIARSTMTDLFHRNAELLSALPKRLLECVAQSEIVQADETSIKMLGTTKRAYLWTFISGKLIAYRFSADRSGQTPKEVLGGTRGTLVVDAYTGYNHVTRVDGRTRSGCLAHARRKLFVAQDAEPDVALPLEIIGNLYLIEDDAEQLGVEGTAEHLQLRQQRGRPLMAKLLCWLRKHRGRHPPKSKTGRAVSYALNNRRQLCRFLFDARIPLDNNRAEAALRPVALGRKNFLFVGNEDAGENIAGLYSLVATCEANGVNPIEYLKDVLIRISTHPAHRIDELLPDRWKPP